MLIHAHIWSYMLIWAHICSYMLIHAHTCSYMLIHAHIYIYIYMFIQSVLPPKPPRRNINSNLRISQASICQARPAPYKMFPKSEQVVRAPGLSHKRQYKSGLMLLEPLALQHFPPKTLQTNTGFTVFPKIMLLEPIFFKNISQNHVAKNNDFRTFTKIMLVEPVVLQ